jgi:hypothetical protein
VVGGPAEPWERAGFVVDRGAIHLEGVKLQLDVTAPPGLHAWELSPSWPEPLDGLPPAAGGHVPGAPTGGRHPNGVVALDHVVVLTDDPERTTAALATAGLTPRRTVDAARGDAGVRYRFFLLGTCVLELIGPSQPSTDAPGPARFGGLAFAAADLAMVAHVTGDAGDAVQPGRRIATVRREVGLGVPVAFLTPRPDR